MSKPSRLLKLAASLEAMNQANKGLFRALILIGAALVGIGYACGTAQADGASRFVLESSSRIYDGNLSGNEIVQVIKDQVTGECDAVLLTRYTTGYAAGHTSTNLGKRACEPSKK